ncbi:MAG TPA: ABC transporter permease [Terracidiphilus sp.]|jgi:predicted permease
MRTLRALTQRLLGLFRSRSDFDAELESHIALHTDALIRTGLDPREARRQALIRLGGAEQTRQAHRERRTLPWLESIIRDLAYGMRTLVKHRGATAIAILSIGLGIGANATIFSMVSRFVLRPPPVGDPTSLLALHTIPSGETCCSNFPYPMYVDMRDQAKSFSGVAAYDALVPASIGGGSGEPERVFGQAVTSNFFEVLQIPMLLGRGFVSGEDRVQEIVLGAALWQRSFSADPAIIGKTVSLSGHAYTVIGVVTPAFHSIDQVLGTEFWVPLASDAQLSTHPPDFGSRNTHWIDAIARLKPGVTRDEAASELNVMARRFGQSYPKTDKDLRFVFEQAGSLPPRDRGTVLIFFAALSVVVLLVLFIAGANVANLLFAQAASRQRDMAVRLALGATAARLRRQMLIESLLLGLGGGALGILLSLWSTHALSMLHIPAPVPVDVSIRVDWRVLLYSFALSAISGLLLGVAPAWAASRPRLASALRGEDALARPGRRISLRNILVIAQIAMSVVLLSVTGLFLRSLQSAAALNIGFRTDNLLLMSIDPRVHGYTPERTVVFLTQLQQRVAAIPGVVSAIVTDVPPLNGGYRSDGFQAVGASGHEHSTDSAELYMVTPGYFQTIGTPLLAGSDFGPETSTGPKVVVVNQAFVNSVFPSQNPIGQLVTGGGVTYRIIGVSGNIKSRTLGEDLRPVVYRSLKQNVASDPSMFGYTLVIHTAANMSPVQQAARKQIHALDASMAIFNEETMKEHVSTAYFLPRLAASLFGTFGFIGLVLAGTGLYGVMSYAVSRRTREIGIRMALGAKPGTVERLILRQGLVLTLIAIALGWPAAWMLAKMASSFLYGIQPHDAFTFAFVPPFLAVIALAACYIPARRAASVDPMQALRTE